MRKIFTTLLLLSFCMMPAIAIKVNEPGPPIKMPGELTKTPEAKTQDTQANTKSETNSSAKTNTSKDNHANNNTETSYSSDDSGEPIQNQLKSLAMAILKAAEKRDNNAAQAYFQKMLELGITSYSNPQVATKKTPDSPPLKMELNGKNLSGNLCAKMGYVYEEQTYWVGYCKE